MTGILIALFIAALLLTFILSVIMLKKTIPILKSHKVGQKILDIGPRWHKSKEGTPTMGGICFIIPTLVVSLAIFVYAAIDGEVKNLVPLALTLLLGVMNALIGFVDDYTKLIKKQNEGLLRLQKLFLQLVISTAYVIVMAYTGNFPTEFVVPFTETVVDLGWAYYRR